MRMENSVGIVQELAEKLKSQDEEIRRLAVVELARRPLDEMGEYLYLAMGDGSWRVRKEAVDALLTANIGEIEVEQLINLLRSHENAGLRNSAVETLERLGPRALPVLSRHVDDNDHDVRKFVIDIMGNIGDSGSCPFLISALDDPDHNVRAAAAENLGKIGDPTSVPHLVRSLEKDDIWLRFTILEALSRIGRPVPMEVIAPLAEENLLKKAIFDCLGAIGGKEAVPLLMAGLKEKVKSARDAAALAAIKLRERLPLDETGNCLDAHLRELAGSPFVEGLLASFDTSDRNLQEALIRMFGIIGDERATVSLLHSFRDDRLRRTCLQAFKNMGEPGASSLVSAFPTADNEERSYIIYLCGELRYPGCIRILDEGMRDKNPTLRKVSAQAAGKIGMITMLNSIVHLLDDAEPEVREGAVEALSRLAEHHGDDVAKVAVTLATAASPEKRRDAVVLLAAITDVEKLSLLIKDEDAMVRKAAVQSLGALNSPTSIGHLVMALVDEETDVRIAAANALGDVGGTEVIEPLLLTMKDGDPWVASAAMRSLGRLGSERALQAIEEMMAGAEGLVMIAALETLAEIGGDRALDLVKTALDNPDEEVVKAAISILSHNGDSWLTDYRERLLSHPHWDVRKNTIRVMAEKWGEKSLPYLRSAYEVESDEQVKGQIAEILDRFQ